VATRSAHVVGLSDAPVNVILVTGSDFVVPLVLALWTPVLVLRMLLVLASGATLRPLSLVPRRAVVGLRSCATPCCVQRCRQCPLVGVARTPVQTLSFSLSLL
jgi:hypothetical protein